MLRNFDVTLTFIWPWSDFFNFTLIVITFFIYWWIYFILGQNKSYELTDMLDDFTWFWLLHDLDLQGQIFQFCFNCHYCHYCTFTYWWILLIFWQNYIYDLTTMFDMTLTFIWQTRLRFSVCLNCHNFIIYWWI